jgi:cyanophycinase-like exopeptidase
MEGSEEMTDSVRRRVLRGRANAGPMAGADVVAGSIAATGDDGAFRDW